MATYSELKAQLTDSQFIVYLALASTDSFKRVVVYENNAGLTGTLSAVGLGVANLTLEDLPAIVEASVLADAIRTGTRNKIVWNTIEVAAQTGVIDGGGSGEIDQDQLTAIMESIDTKVDAKTKSMFKYKGHVNTVSDLPASGNEEGDVYRVDSEGEAEYVWIEGDNAHWEFVGKTFDLTNFYTKSEVDNAVGGVADAVTALGNATDTKFAAEEAARIQAVNAVANSVAAEESARVAAVQSVDEKISFAELINRIWIYGENVFDLNLMVKPGMYYCSSDASVVGNAMTNMPDGTAEGCLLVLKNSQIFWEGGTNKGRTYYRYQTGAGPNVSEYTEAWTASAMLSDVEKLKEYLLELNRLQVSANETQNESIRELTDAHYDLEEKVSGIAERLDYTAFEVYATDAVIPAGTVDPDTEIAYKFDVPANMTESIKLRTICKVEDSDVVIDWGDGDITNVSDVDPSTVEVDGNEYNVVVAHTYATTGKYIVKIFGRKYFGFGSGQQSIVSRMLDHDLPIAKHISFTGNLAFNSYKLLKIDVPTYMLSAGLFNCSSMFSNIKNLHTATGLRYFQSSIRNFTYAFNGNRAFESTDFIFPGYVRDGAIGYAFADCVELSADINKLIPSGGFVGATYDINKVFYNCKKLYGTVPASKLWENTDIVWTNTANAFAGCSDAIRAQVPTSWGGTNTEIEAKLQSGYFRKLRKFDIEALESDVTNIKDALNDARVPNVQFIDGGTQESPAVVNLQSGIWYVAVSPFTGTLPESPSDGTIIQISYEHGQANMVVVPAGSDTINEAPNPCLIGVTPEGVPVDNESHRFVYRAGNWILL